MRRKLPPRRTSGLSRKPPPSPFEAQREAAKRQALNALKRAQREAEKAGVTLSDWEGEFLGSVAERVKTYGRAFGDPEKGAPGQALSGLQARKLREITVKAKGDGAKGEGEPPSSGRRAFRGARRPGPETDG